MVWIAWLDGVRRAGEFKQRSVAMNSFIKPYYLAGKAEVRNPRTGETFERKFGSWFRTQPAYAPGRQDG